MDRMSTARGWLVGCLVALGMFIIPLTAGAEVKPGDYITVDNASKVKDLLSPGVYWRVKNGMTMKIVPTERIDWPPPYKDGEVCIAGSFDHRSSVVGRLRRRAFCLSPSRPLRGKGPRCSGIGIGAHWPLVRA